MGLLSKISAGLGAGAAPSVSAPFENLNGLPFGQSGLVASLYDDRIVFQVPGSESIAFVEYERINAVSYTQDVDVTVHEVDKNPIVRGIIGNVIAGKQGAMIGAISGIGTKMVEHKESYGVLEISYTDASGMPAAMALRDSNPSSGNGKRLAQVLRQLSGQGTGPAEIRL